MLQEHEGDKNHQPHSNCKRDDYLANGHTNEFRGVIADTISKACRKILGHPVECIIYGVGGGEGIGSGL